MHVGLGLQTLNLQPGKQNLGFGMGSDGTMFQITARIRVIYLSNLFRPRWTAALPPYWTEFPEPEGFWRHMITRLINTVGCTTVETFSFIISDFARISVSVGYQAPFNCSPRLGHTRSWISSNLSTTVSRVSHRTRREYRMPSVMTNWQ
jgi:hypothetical protein